MAVNELAPIARFEFGAGPLRGSELVLYRTSVVHRGGAELETLQLGAIAALRVAFARDTLRLNWGIVLVIVALLFLLAGRATPSSRSTSAPSSVPTPHAAAIRCCSISPTA